MTTLILTIALSGMLHSFGEIRRNRSQYTWLPRWVWSGDNWIPGTEGIWYLQNIDGYHVFKMLSYYAAGQSFWDAAMMGINPLLFWGIFFLVWGVSMDLCYHIVFMKPKYMFKIKEEPIGTCNNCDDRVCAGSSDPVLRENRQKNRRGI